MILNHFAGLRPLKRYGVIAALVGAFFLMGCGGSEEATQEDQGMEPAVQQDKPAMDQALTSFVGEKEPEKKPEPAQTEPAKPEPVVTPQPSDADKQIEELRTENTTLKQKLVKLEQDAQMMNARLTEYESKLAAEKERADKAEEALKGKVPVVEEPAKPMAGGSYDDALMAFKAKKYDDASKMFQGLLDAGVSKDLADNCTYWIGESKFAKRKYKDAMANFEAVMQFKVSEKKADAQYMIAQCLERTGNKVEAKAAYEKVVKDYPMSSLVKKAKARWAKL
jgi:tol-pal system protein YbgF